MSLTNQREFSFGSFHLKLGARVLERDGARIPLGSKAFDVLTQLVMRAGEVVTKDQLMKAVWPNSFVEESNLTQHIFALRKALGDRSDYIVTIPGRGYQFAGPVREIAIAAPDEQPSLRAESSEIVIHTTHERSHMVMIEETTHAPGVTLAVSAPRGLNAVQMYTATALVGAAAVLGWGGWRLAHRNAADEFHSIVVADFANGTGDETFDRTLKRALEIDLAQSPSLNVMSASEAVSTLKMMGQRSDEPLTGDTVREVCERSNRQAVLSGGIARMGKSYVLTLEATDCASGKKLAGAKAQAETKEDVLAGLDTVADRVRSKLGESKQSIENYQVPIAQATTSSLEALRAYSVGNFLLAQGRDGRELIAIFQRAVDLDPQFAMAWGSLASVYFNQNEFALATQCFKRAFELSDHVSSREKLILRAHYYGEGAANMQEGIKTYQFWAATYPHDTSPYINLINLYTGLGQYPQAIEVGESALKALPPTSLIYVVLVRACKRGGQFAEAKNVAAQAAQNGKDAAGIHASLWQIAYAEHDEAGLEHEVEWAKTHSDSWYRWFLLDLQANAAGAEGRFKDSEELFRQTIEMAKSEGLAETADDLTSDKAWQELELGHLELARSTASQIAHPDANRAETATLRAALGEVAYAERALAEISPKVQPGSQDDQIILPTLRASIAMARGKPLETVGALETAKPYELGDFFIPSLRGAAYLKAGQAGPAIIDYQKVTANVGVDPASPLLTLAHLGLARAYTIEGKPGEARAEYQVFLRAWKGADADEPLLKMARTELAKVSK